MKKLLFFFLFLLPFSTFATEKCDPNKNISNTDYRIIEKIVKQKNNEEKNKWSFVLRNRAFDISSLDFGNLYFSRQWNVIGFWKWSTGGWLDGWPCHYPERVYSLTKAQISYEIGKYPKNKKLSYEEMLTELRDNERYNLYADENAPSLASGTLFGGTIVYETGVINNYPYIVTKNIWEFDGSTNYSLWFIGKKYNYKFYWPHNNNYTDVEIWKNILKSIQFLSK